MIDKSIIRDFLGNRSGKKDQFTDDESLLAAQIIDSLAIAELIVFLQDTYGVEFDADELTPDNFETVNAMAACLERKGVSSLC